MDKVALRLLVGGEIRAHRESQDLTLHFLADMSGTSYTHLWKVENGKVGVGLDLLGRISSALDVPLCKLVDPNCIPGNSIAIEYQPSHIHHERPSDDSNLMQDCPKTARGTEEIIAHGC